MNLFTIIYRILSVSLLTALLVVATLLLRTLERVPSLAELEKTARQKDFRAVERLKNRIPAVTNYGTLDVSGTVTVEPDLLNPLEVSSMMSGPLPVSIEDIAFGIEKKASPLPIVVIQKWPNNSVKVRIEQ